MLCANPGPGFCLSSDLSAVPKRGHSKRGRTLKHANARKRAQMSAKERKRKSAKERKAQRAQNGAKERFRVKIANDQSFETTRGGGRGDVCGEFWGGGAKFFFFSGPNCPPSSDQERGGVQKSMGSKLSGPVLRDTARLSQRYPPIARCGVFGVSTWPIGCDTPSPFSERFPPLRVCEVEVRYPPPQKGYLSDTCAIPYENKANGCDAPLCDTISKGYCAIWGVSRTGPLR